MSVLATKSGFSPNTLYCHYEHIHEEPMRYVFVFLLMFFAQSHAESDTSTQPESMLLALMADAEEEKYEYFVKTSVDTDYRVSS